MRSLSDRNWEMIERVVGTWLLALIVVLSVLLAVVVACRVVVVAGRALEQGQEGLTRQARAYPDPVCEWCGGIMDGHGCQCEGVEQ